MKNEELKVSVLIIYPFVLTLLFVILKVCNVIDWSWVWVLSPTWLPFLVILLLMLVVLLVSVAKFFEK
ncbi:hypothetical protein ACT4R9_09595 [Ornithobacterium rhinotracheale]|uniref:hypothetical protein n=1 Tax=Ornithobacterium rhinotracheale TaxID=28251 RepID=UPI001FF587CE|nr:hypothetical protein [Ornithobacterium rhinotracheale]MCK0206195.1 hypothetical protein [Ornithobacterium rhinotracheale]